MADTKNPEEAAEAMVAKIMEHPLAGSSVPRDVTRAYLEGIISGCRDSIQAMREDERRDGNASDDGDDGDEG